MKENVETGFWQCLQITTYCNACRHQTPGICRDSKKQHMSRHPGKDQGPQEVGQLLEPLPCMKTGLLGYTQAGSCVSTPAQDRLCCNRHLPAVQHSLSPAITQAEGMQPQHTPDRLPVLGLHALGLACTSPLDVSIACRSCLDSSRKTLLWGWCAQSRRRAACTAPCQGSTSSVCSRSGGCGLHAEGQVGHHHAESTAASIRTAHCERDLQQAPGVPVT